MSGSSLKESLRQGKLSLGTWITLGHAGIAEIFAKAGFEWLAVDLEHSTISIERAGELIRTIDLAGVSPLVHLTSNDIDLIKRVIGVAGDDAAEFLVERGVGILDGVAPFVADEGEGGALGLGVDEDRAGIVAADGSSEDGRVAGFYELDGGAGDGLETFEEIGKPGSGVHSIQGDGL